MTYDGNQLNIELLSKEYAEGTKRTVFFVGAGGSAEVGMPTWAALRDDLLKTISDEVDSRIADEETLESFRDLEELAQDNSKFWNFFSLVSKFWPVTYADFMTRNFDDRVPKVATPKIYQRIWKMSRSRQVFTLNVDSLISRAFREIHADPKNHQLLEYDGFNVMDSLSFLARDSFCIINLHGTYHQKSRWIMDGDQRSRLNSGEYGAKYAAYLTRLFSEYNVVFVGLNPADIALSPFLSKAVELGLVGRHFWICPNPAPDTSRWAQSNGVRVVSYSPDKNEEGSVVHSHDICSILDQVEAYISKDKRVSLPPTCAYVDPTDLGEPLDLVANLSRDRAKFTEMLSGAVTSIGETNGYSSKEMDTFLKRYSVPLQMASMVDDRTSGFDRVSQYKLISNIQSSGSSSVWTAQDNSASSDDYCALKIMSSSGLSNLTERQSFRRGVESLFLLTQAGASVAPKYLSHSEIPLSLAMEHVPGGTLREFREANTNVAATNMLDLFLKICSAVLACHQSAGHVLHRDVKPGNILLEGWYPGYELNDALQSRTRLINFDLSWHRFTSGNTKAISADDIGYYAPEQRYSANSLPPRTAATDVYMLGMVLYFLISGENPPDGGSRIQGWHGQISQKVKTNIKDTLVSNRMSRMIQEMTEVDPDQRVDLSSVCGELEAIIAWISGKVDSIDDDLFVENLAAASQRDYVWERAGLFAMVQTRQSTHFEVRYQHRGRKAVFTFYRRKSDSDNRANFGDRMKQRISASVDTLKNGGWVARADGNKGVQAEIKVSQLRDQSNFGTNIWPQLSTQLLSAFD
ncbi:protein kinase domain-containing protein [Roseovarius dicentrarchi]|uniref:protein kinase domain-containing protein n=1 Tax=Roseovarius dicentrarchi TaxID=2250573 RepID=UPI0013966CA0|nr:SIR2 family protein [Roseovarius dicentrarchi]